MRALLAPVRRLRQLALDEWVSQLLVLGALERYDAVAARHTIGAGAARRVWRWLVRQPRWTVDLYTRFGRLLAAGHPPDAHALEALCDPDRLDHLPAHAHLEALGELLQGGSCPPRVLTRVYEQVRLRPSTVAEAVEVEVQTAPYERSREKLMSALIRHPEADAALRVRFVRDLVARDPDDPTFHDALFAADDWADLVCGDAVCATLHGATDPFFCRLLASAGPPAWRRRAFGRLVAEAPGAAACLLGTMEGAIEPVLAPIPPDRRAGADPEGLLRALTAADLAPLMASEEPAVREAALVALGRLQGSSPGA